MTTALAALLEALLAIVWYLVCGVCGLLAMALIAIGTALSWLRQPEGESADLVSSMHLEN